MKLLAAPVLALVVGLMAFPMVFAGGDDPGLGCSAENLAPILATIRTLESGGDYTIRATGSTASGAYQFLDSSWSNYGGYPRAWLAPPEMQDAKAVELIGSILDRYDGDVSAIPVVWYIGHVPTADSDEWDTVPHPEAGNVATPRAYQQRWLAELDRQLATPAVDAPVAPVPACTPGLPITALADGYAYPGPPELFATADVDEPHHDYPAWDWLIPEGTPVYAVHAGRIVTVQYWPHNWWDQGCSADATGCRSCGIGVTVEDDTGTRWAYCHGSAVHVGLGATVTAGTQLLTSGNTGRSGAPHLHLQITTPDGQLRCPQPLLRTLRDQAAGVDSATLATAGCSF